MPYGTDNRQFHDNLLEGLTMWEEDKPGTFVSVLGHIAPFDGQYKLVPFFDLTGQAYTREEANLLAKALEQGNYLLARLESEQYG